jgi:hypothetical protein
MTASPQGGYFSGWIDFDGNGAFDEPEIFQDQWLIAGTVHTLDFDVPTHAVVGMTYARFRISSQQGARPDGWMPDGEVEDYRVAIGERTDFGDAPDSYGTTWLSNGAIHDLGNWQTGPRLGASVDGEADGTPSPAADGDDTSGTDDEDGVVFQTGLIPGRLAQVQIDSRFSPAAGLLSGWIDFDGDGNWDSGEERILDREFLTPGSLHTFTFEVPAGAFEGETYARFRISTLGQSDPGPHQHIRAVGSRRVRRRWRSRGLSNPDRRRP